MKRNNARLRRLSELFKAALYLFAASKEEIPIVELVGALREIDSEKVLMSRSFFLDLQ